MRGLGERGPEERETGEESRGEGRESFTTEHNYPHVPLLYLHVSHSADLSSSHNPFDIGERTPQTGSGVPDRISVVNTMDYTSAPPTRPAEGPPGVNAFAWRMFKPLHGELSEYSSDGEGYRREGGDRELPQCFESPGTLVIE